MTGEAILVEKTTSRFQGDLNIELEEKVVSSLVDDQLPCAVAFKIDRELKVSPREVGKTADKLGIRIVNCQLGCFQVEKATHQNLNGIDIKKMLLEAIEASLVNGNLPCAVALEVARKLKVAPKKVGDTATKQKIKISQCQLGCFP
jgi:hypothetical protein